MEGLKLWGGREEEASVMVSVRCAFMLCAIVEMNHPLVLASCMHNNSKQLFAASSWVLVWVHSYSVQIKRDQGIDVATNYDSVRCMGQNFTRIC